MGREIRRVPPNWEHPKDSDRSGSREGYRPLYDDDYETAADAWLAGLLRWERGEAPGRTPGDRYYWDYEGQPPVREYYRPKWDEGVAVWFQIYETVSEGTPVTPPFATREELISYLVTHGDFWDQHRGDGGWPRAAAERLVSSGYAPSLMTNSSPEGVRVMVPRDMVDL